MRYLGNKTRLIPFLCRTLERLEIPRGVAADPFAGTASVSRALKRLGWRVHAGDVMASSFALQVARVALDGTPSYPAHLLPGSARPAGKSRASYAQVLAWLDRLPARPGFITRHYTPNGAVGRRYGRRYFTDENAGRLDAIREQIDRWVKDEELDTPRAQLLIATLLEAADRVANTTGVYASFVKSWQPNALRPLQLRPLRPAPRRNGVGPSTAFRGPALHLLARTGAVDLLYLDPPYNGRQYPAYYHIPELLAVGWNPPPPLRGKTGLIPDDDRRSDWCRKRKAGEALRALLDASDARHILLSYNDEGILSTTAIETALRERGRPDTYRRFARPYRRYRSDADRKGRSYRRNRVEEYLHYVET